MRYDALIIGAGLSGLAAGIRLALFDKKVLIVEKHVEIGGLNSFYVRKQRTFDVGLHAMTNYSPPGVRSSPLGKLLKQLRLRHEDLGLCEQIQSEVRFPEHRLRFTNEFAFFEQEVAEQFPGQRDGFQKLLARIRDFNELDLNLRGRHSSREILESCMTDPVLIDMLFCPLMYYGNAAEHDMDFYQFVIMFKSVFMEGFARPAGGMPYILGLLLDKYRALGGEIRMGAPVAALHTRNRELVDTEHADGDRIQADRVLSSAGYVETMQMVQPAPVHDLKAATGQVSFMESLFVLDRPARDLGLGQSIVFYCTTPRFHYRVPDELIDITSGVFCVPDNFRYPQPPPEGMVRLTQLANFGLWDRLPRSAYRQAKKDQRQRAVEEALKFFPDFRPNVVFLDTFTPKTIFKYTGHLNGAVYGSPNKIKDGTTPVKNLFICGTDQGFMGIIGATLSGISMANLRVLLAPSTPTPEAGEIHA
ncbi:MAG: phytoene desaturase family protein [Nitrospinaceae bacterium]